jgi:hypothetical protein
MKHRKAVDLTFNATRTRNIQSENKARSLSELTGVRSRSVRHKV